ncbi:hypothetical protein ACLOJK_040851 [Asimina triloba]
MDEKQKILELRERLDITLASPRLADSESVKGLVRKQLLSSSLSATEGDVEGVVQRRTTEILKFLDLSRSVAQNDREVSRTQGRSHGDWKDNEQLRVMYREGPQGSPFHTLLVEGYVDGPIDVCVDFFSDCLEERVKVPWPVSAREAIVHYFELECFEDDLVIVQMNTVSDKEHVDVHTHGFTCDGIPEARDIVRIDMAGGMALMRMGSNKSYFRSSLSFVNSISSIRRSAMAQNVYIGHKASPLAKTLCYFVLIGSSLIDEDGSGLTLAFLYFSRTIANFDVKLDFLPAAFINFVSRQLIGSGFKLFQKAVASITHGDADYKKILEEKPMYIRIRGSLNSHNEVNSPKILEQDRPSSSLTELHALETINTDNMTATDEIESDEEEQAMHWEVNGEVHHSVHQIAEQHDGRKEAHFLSPEVEQALCVLDKAIAAVRRCEKSSNFPMRTLSAQQKVLKSTRLENFGMTSNEFRVIDATGEPSEDSTIQNLRVADTSNPSGEDSRQKELDSRQLYPNSPTLNKIQAKASSSSDDVVSHSNTLAARMPQRMNGHQGVADSGAKEVHGKSVDSGGKEKCTQGKKKKKQRLCCM